MPDNTASTKPRRRSSASAEPAISDLQTHLGFWLRFVSNHVSGSFRKQVEGEGVTVSEWVALRQIYGAGATTHTALTDALGMTKGAVSKILSRLEQKNLIERVVDESDLRAQQIRLTRQGTALVPRLAALADANDEAFFGHLSAQQRRTLIRQMQEIVRLHQLQQLPVE